MLNAGDILDTHYKHTLALEFYQEAENLAVASEIKKYQYNILYKKSIAFKHKKMLEEAYLNIKEALQIAIKENRNDRIINCYKLLGIIARDNKEFDKSITFISKIFDYIQLLERKDKKTKSF